MRGNKLCYLAVACRIGVNIIIKNIGQTRRIAVDHRWNVKRCKAVLFASGIYCAVDHIDYGADKITKFIAYVISADVRYVFKRIILPQKNDICIGGIGCKKITNFDHIGNATNVSGGKSKDKFCALCNLGYSFGRDGQNGIDRLVKGG